MSLLCPHSPEQINRSSGDCFACGASAMKVIDSLQVRLAQYKRFLETLEKQLALK